MDSGEESDYTAVSVTVHGLVQGVGFRYWTCREARRLGVTGRVRNNGDGSVTVVCEGPAGNVGLLVQRLKNGPPGARVERMETHRLPTRRRYEDFTVEFT